MKSSDHCNGLNVVSDDEVWFYHEGLTKIVNGEVKVTYRNLPSVLSQDFAVSEPIACWVPAIVSTRFFVACDLSTGESKSFDAMNEGGRKHVYDRVAARGAKLYFTNQKDLCVIDLENLNL